MKTFKINDSVQWKWLGRNIEGIVKEIYFEPVVKVIKEKSIKRNASKENPAYLVESVAGNLALKLQSELELIEKKKSSKAQPKMFR